MDDGTIWEQIERSIDKPPPNLNVAGFVNVRLGSSRVPDKGILPLAGYPAWWHSMQRVEAGAKLCGIKLVGKAVITSGHPENDILEEQAHHYGYDCIRHEPEYDTPGRKLKACDYYGVDIFLSLGADTVLAAIEHLPLAWEALQRCNAPPQFIWKDNQLSGAPHRSVGQMVNTMAFGLRWDQARARSMSLTEEDYQAQMFQWVNPETRRRYRMPRGSWVEAPEWLWSYARPYRLELDTWEDAVQMMLLYDKFWEGPGTIVDWRKCVDYLDANPRMLYNRSSKESAINTLSHEQELGEMGWLRYLDFCESYLCPVDARRIYCWACGEYLGYKAADGSLHAPDTTPVFGGFRLSCRQGHFRLWQGTLEHAISSGSAVIEPLPVDMWGGQ